MTELDQALFVELEADDLNAVSGGSFFSVLFGAAQEPTYGGIVGLVVGGTVGSVIGPEVGGGPDPSDSSGHVVSGRCR